MPSLPLSNRFAALSIVPDNEDTIVCQKLGHVQQWERNLQKHFIVAASPSPNLLNLKVEIQTTNTAEVKGVTALLDSVQPACSLIMISLWLRS
jgi:hypothetical protein